MNDVLITHANKESLEKDMLDKKYRLWTLRRDGRPPDIGA